MPFRVRIYHGSPSSHEKSSQLHLSDVPEEDEEDVLAELEENGHKIVARHMHKVSDEDGSSTQQRRGRR